MSDEFSFGMDRHWVADGHRQFRRVVIRPPLRCYDGVPHEKAGAELVRIFDHQHRQIQGKHLGTRNKSRSQNTVRTDVPKRFRNRFRRAGDP